MIALAGFTMVGAGAACFGGALVARRRLGIIAAFIMLIAMIDLAWFGLVASVWWAVLLFMAGILLGIDLRIAARMPGASASPLHAGGQDRLASASAIASALAYPAAAWLVLGHAGDATAGAGQAHAGHSSGVFTSVVPVVLMLVLTAVLIWLCIATASRRKPLLALETGAMAAMILAMLVMPH